MITRDPVTSLATLALEDVTYDILEVFCQQQAEEDIDLDYKAAFPNDIDRIICAFANTQGGIILLGISEHGKRRIPICPPGGIEGDPDVLRQRILNKAYDAIYPPVEPEVKVVSVPGTNNHVVVVRVTPSSLLHAVDHRSRIYIRSLDNNRGYALASLPTLQWLWDKRSASTAFRNSLVDAALARASSTAIGFPEGYSQQDWLNSPHLWISICPAFPQHPPPIHPRALLDAANSLGEVRSTWRNVDRRVPWQQNQWRTIGSGVCIQNRGFPYTAQYIELGLHGQAVFDFLVRSQPVRELPLPRNTDQHCVFAYVLLSSLEISLRYAARFHQELHLRRPIVIKATLGQVANLLLLFHTPTSTNPLALERLSPPCPDQLVQLIEGEFMSEELTDRPGDLLLTAAKSLIWSFGLGWDEKDIAGWLHAHDGSKSA